MVTTKRRGRPPGSKNKTPVKTPQRTPARTPLGSRKIRKTSKNVTSYEKVWINGCFRAPKSEEIVKLLQILKDIQDKRIEAFNLIVNMVSENGHHQKAERIKKHIKNLVWALNPKNVRETDLPTIDNSNVADLSVWVYNLGTNFAAIFNEIDDACHCALSKYAKTPIEKKNINRIKVSINPLKIELKKFIKGLELSEDGREMVSSCEFLEKLLKSR